MGAAPLRQLDSWCAGAGAAGPRRCDGAGVAGDNAGELGPAQGAQPQETAQQRQGQGQGQQKQRLQQQRQGQGQQKQWLQQQREEQEVAQKLDLPARTRNPPHAAKRKMRSHTSPGGCDRSDDGALLQAQAGLRRSGLPFRAAYRPAPPHYCQMWLAGRPAGQGARPVYDYAQLECVD